MISSVTGAGGIELKGQALRGEVSLRGGEWDVASSFKSVSLEGELEDEGASRIFLRLDFLETTGCGSSSVASAISSSRELAEGTGDGSRSKTAVSMVGPFSGRGGMEDSTACPYSKCKRQAQNHTVKDCKQSKDQIK